MRNDLLTPRDRAAMERVSPDPELIELSDAVRVWAVRFTGHLQLERSQILRRKLDPTLHDQYLTEWEAFTIVWNKERRSKHNIHEGTELFDLAWAGECEQRQEYLINRTRIRSVVAKEARGEIAARDDYTEHMLRALAGGQLAAFLLRPEQVAIPAERWRRLLPLITAAEAAANSARYQEEYSGWPQHTTDPQLKTLAHSVEWEAYQRDSAAGDENARARLLSLIARRTPAARATMHAQEQLQWVGGTFKWMTDEAEPDQHGYRLARAGLKSKNAAKGSLRSHPYVRVADFAAILAARFDPVPAPSSAPSPTPSLTPVLRAALQALVTLHDQRPASCSKHVLRAVGGELQARPSRYGSKTSASDTSIRRAWEHWGAHPDEAEAVRAALK